ADTGQTVAVPEGAFHHYYRIEGNAGENPLITLESARGGIEVFAAEGRMPTESDLDRIMDDGRLLLPFPEGGTWYILVQGDDRQVVSDYTIERATQAIAVSRIFPERGGADAHFEPVVDGVGFEGDVDFILTNEAGNDFAADSVEVTSYETLNAFFAAGTFTPGTYDMRLVRDDG